MSGIHGEHNVILSVLGVKTDGYSNDLAVNQLAIVDTDPKLYKKDKGNKIVNSLTGYSKKKSIFDKRFLIQSGVLDNGAFSFISNKNDSTIPFDYHSILEVGGESIHPSRLKQSVDEVVIGYDGYENTLSIKKGQTRFIELVLSGQPIANLGVSHGVYKFRVLLSEKDCPQVFETCEDCDPCGEVNCYKLTQYAIKAIQEHKVKGTEMYVKDLIDVVALYNPAPIVGTLKLQKKFCLELCDTGDNSALSEVQNYYPNFKVTQKERNGAITKYEIDTPEKDSTGTTISVADYEHKLGATLKGCKACEAGSAELPGGFVYRVVLEDDGDSKEADVEGLPNAVAGTAVKYGFSNPRDMGNYSVLLTQPLTEAEISTFLSTNKQAEIALVSRTEAYCQDPTVITTPWVECGSCSYTEQTYEIVVPDTKCDGVATGVGTRLADLKLNYPDYNVQLTTTIIGGCQSKYTCVVPTNVICEGCSIAEFKDFKSEAPAPFEDSYWHLVTGTEPIVSKCGIKLKGKTQEVLPDQCLYNAGVMPEESSVLITVSGGEITDNYIGTNQSYEPGYVVKIISNASPSEGSAWRTWDMENVSKRFFKGNGYIYKDTAIQNYIGEGGNTFPANTKLVSYWVTLENKYLSQSGSGEHSSVLRYSFLVELGKHKELEKLINEIASFADLDPVIL